MTPEARIPVAVLGATGMVGQRFVTLLENHPQFEVAAVAASPDSAGKSYEDAVKGRWHMEARIPESVARMKVLRVEDDIENIRQRAGVIFCALGIDDKQRIRQIEDAYAERGVAVISNNSAHRGTLDVPVIIPEVNAGHADVIFFQRQKRGWDKGLIAVKPNCSIQPYVIPLDALKAFEPQQVIVTTEQAVSGKGRTLGDWPQIIDNVIPFIPGEEKKSEEEPLKVWGRIENGVIVPTDRPDISATCLRVPVSDGHLAIASVIFGRTPSRGEILDAFQTYNHTNQARLLKLPSAPEEVIVYREEDDRPQPKLDRMEGNGMSVVVGRLREDRVLKGWKFIGLSHNTIRGAAGGGIETAELLVNKGYISS